MSTTHHLNPEGVFHIKRNTNEELYEQLLDGRPDPLLDVLNYAISKANDKKKLRSLMNLTSRFLLNEIGADKMQAPFNVVPHKLGLSYHVVQHIRISIANTESDEILSSLLADQLDFITHYGKFSGKAISQKKVMDVLSIAERFNLTKMLVSGPLNSSSLSVCLVPYGHKFNSAYFPALNLIACHKTRQNDHPEYVFMHELGHVVQFHLTRSIEELRVPESFHPLLELTFNQPADSFSPVEMTEIFADVFSAALSFGTDYAEKCPFHNLFVPTHQKMFHEYFRLLGENSSMADSENFWVSGAHKDKAANLLNQKPTKEEERYLLTLRKGNIS